MNAVKGCTRVALLVSHKTEMNGHKQDFVKVSAWGMMDAKSFKRRVERNMTADDGFQSLEVFKLDPQLLVDFVRKNGKSVGIAKRVAGQAEAKMSGTILTEVPPPKKTDEEKAAAREAKKKVTDEKREAKKKAAAEKSALKKEVVTARKALTAARKQKDNKQVVKLEKDLKTAEMKLAA